MLNYLTGMSIAAMGFYASKGPFWSIPSMILTGTAAASGIAWINSRPRRFPLPWTDRPGAA